MKIFDLHISTIFPLTQPIDKIPQSLFLALILFCAVGCTVTDPMVTEHPNDEKKGGDEARETETQDGTGSTIVNPPPKKCGNGEIDEGESCDSQNLNGSTCDTVGNFTGGTLSCTNSCTFDTSGCIKPATGGSVRVEKGKVLINEVMAFSSIRNVKWIELRNTLNQSVNLANCTIGSPTVFYTFKEGETIAPQGYYTLSTTQDPGFNLKGNPTKGRHGLPVEMILSNAPTTLSLMCDNVEISRVTVETPEKDVSYQLDVHTLSSWCKTQQSTFANKFKGTPMNSNESCGSGSAEPSSPQGVFFSRYLEGSGEDKAIAIYNASQNEVKGCTVNLYRNGSRQPGSTFTILPLNANQSFVICHANARFAGNPNLCHEKSKNLNFNGDDALELICNEKTVDMIGVIGQRQNWRVGTVSTANAKLHRICSVTAGNTTFTETEWEGVAVNESKSNLADEFRERGCN